MQEEADVAQPVISPLPSTALTVSQRACLSLSKG